MKRMLPALASWMMALLATGLPCLASSAPGPVEVIVRTADAAVDGTAAGSPLPAVRVRLGGRYAHTAADGLATLDGVPPGTYKLSIDHPFYDHFEREVVLPPGARERIAADLRPAFSALLQGRVVAAGPADFPLPGAQIRLVPTAVKGALQGPVAFRTGWDGTFATPPIPEGTYRADVSAAGCSPKTFTVEIKRNGAPLSFALDRLSASTRLRVRIADATTGAGLAGAKVTLAETWPHGIVAEQATTADGSVSFANLKIGTLNVADAQGRVDLTRRTLTVRAQKDGYATVVRPLLLGGDSADLSIQLQPVAEQAEREPNNDLATAQKIRLGAPVRFGIPSVGDHDVFQVDLDDPALLRAAVGPANPIQTHLLVWNAQGQLMREQGTYENQDNALEFRVPAGRYFVEVREWGDNAASTPNTLTLLVSSEPATDAREPNDTQETARPIAEGETASGLVWPVGDADYFRFEVQRPGWIRVSEPGAPFQRHALLYNPAGLMLREVGAYENQPLSFDARIEPGLYAIAMREWGDNDCSLSPYRLRFAFIADDGIDDPPPSKPQAVRALPLPGLAGSTLNPETDVDTFALSLPGPGTVRLQATSAIQTHLKIFDAQGRMLTESGAYENQLNSIAWTVGKPSTLYLQIMEWGLNGWAPSPYLLRGWFEPADEMDFMVRNDSFDSATPLLPGDVARGNVLPTGDADVFRFAADFPGYLNVSVPGPMQRHLRIFNAQRQFLCEVGAYENQPANLRPAIGAGTYFLQINEWGDNTVDLKPYELLVSLERAEPAETEPLASDPPRLLKPNEAQTFAIDHVGDVDRFIFSAAAAGTSMVRVVNPAMQIHLRYFNDQTGELVHESGHYENQNPLVSLVAKGPTRFRLELREWGDNAASLAPLAIVAGLADRMPALEAVAATNVPTEPAKVFFRRAPIANAPPAARIGIDVDRNGSADLDVPANGSAAWDFKTPGRYEVTAIFSDATGALTRQRLWVDAIGPRERSGVQVVLDDPAEGQTIERPKTLSAQAVSYTGSKIARVSFELDGRPVIDDYEAPFEADLPWESMGGGEHRLRVLAYDVRGSTGSVTRLFKLSDYFNLLPNDGAMLSGNDVRVSWSGDAFGPATVRHRPRGATNWTETTGESGRARSVRLADLEPGVPIEFQPLGGKEPGPVRTFTRVKGLSFGRPAYSARIERDYEQRIGISVRNNGDAPLAVRLECGKPADPLLLAGFVGEGSEDAPFSLGPGEEREFLLGVSAQDVLVESHAFPIRIASDSGLADQAEVNLSVRLPKVALRWEDVGPAAHGLGHRFRVVNEGDTLTDFAVYSDSRDVSLSPSINHGLLPAGASVEIAAYPRLFDGFTGMSATLFARGLDKPTPHPFKVALNPNEKLFQVLLIPGVSPGDPNVADVEARVRKDLEAAEKLNPTAIDWNLAGERLDVDADGILDRRILRDPAADLVWVGDDTDGDGEVDFIHADLHGDGTFEYSALAGPGGWERTNIIEAWLEMGFKLPWDASSYHPHDVDVVLNGEVVGRLRDAIPSGQYAFRVSPRLLRFDQTGRPVNNRIGIRSTHLRGGHYVVNSDFRFKLRLAPTPVWQAATSVEEARRQVAAIEGVSTDGPDYGISASEIRIDGPAPLPAGAKTEIVVPIRNLGSTAPESVAVALFAEQTEVARILADAVPLTGTAEIRIPWIAASGVRELRVLVDPDASSGDAQRANNEATLSVAVAGDTNAPTLAVESPLADSKFPSPVVPLKIRAQDDGGVPTVSVAVDGGLPVALGGENSLYEATCLLQPGPHRLDVRATDASGNVATSAVAVAVEAVPVPFAIQSPSANAQINARQVAVALSLPPNVQLAAARVENGPWIRAETQSDRATAILPLNYGPQTIEALQVDARGVASTQHVNVVCTQQPTTNAPASSPPPAAGNGRLAIGELPPLDFFASLQHVLPAMPIANAAADPQEIPLPALLQSGSPLEFFGANCDHRLVATGKSSLLDIKLFDASQREIARFDIPLRALDPMGRTFGGDVQTTLAGAPCRVECATDARVGILTTRWSPEPASDISTIWIRESADESTGERP